MIVQGDCLKVLKTMGTGTINCIVTSPPYWGLRDYGVEGQLGLEPRFQDYIEKLLIIFDECKRVLKNEGTLWVNLGDTYSSGTRAKNGCDENNREPKNPEKNKAIFAPNRMGCGIQDKSLIGIPDRFKIAMIDNGWICRNDIIWHKQNAMPSSATDRFTVDYERVFFFTKQGKYYYKQIFVPYAPSSDARYRQALRAGKSYCTKEPYSKNTPYSSYKRGQGSVSSRGDDGDGLVVGGGKEGVNMRTVWTINTKPYKGAHFAVFPEELPKRCIESGCPKGGTVLDIFCGSGTTGVQAKKQGMEFVGIELNPEYIELANKRINDINPLFPEEN